MCAINILRTKFQRVLYIDLDIHHGTFPVIIVRFSWLQYVLLINKFLGDGVENAFAFSQNVLTFSLHKHEVGFYPGSGAITDIGRGNGTFYSVNVPLKDGIKDEPYCQIFNRYLLDIFSTSMHAPIFKLTF